MTNLIEFYKELGRNLETLDHDIGDYHVQVTESWLRGKEVVVTHDGDAVFRYRLSSGIF